MIQVTPFSGGDLPFLACIETLFEGNVVTAGAGTLIGPRLILTAGHVVFDPLHGGKPKGFRVTLGFNPRESIKATNWRAHGQWEDDSEKDAIQRSLAASDFGVVILDKPVDTRLNIGSVNFDTATSDFLNKSVINVAGYSNVPANLPNTAFFAKSRCAVMTKIKHRICYPIATIGGMSGGPVWSRDSSDSRTIRAIHTSIFKKAGNALRIDTPVFQKIQEWHDEFHPTSDSP